MSYNINYLLYTLYNNNLMFKLSVGAMFKNESLIIKEWLDHYIYNGVEHFYLVDDNSDDNYLSIIQYIFKLLFLK